MPSDVMESQLEDLRTRMRLLQQDRRANVDLLEQTKGSNALDVKSLRDEGKELRLRLGQLTKATDGAPGATAAAGGTAEGELTNGQREVMAMRAEYDSLKTLSTKHLKQLELLKDDVKTCGMEARRPTQEDNPLTRQIRMLENRLDKAMIKYNESQSIQSTYQQIAKRLQEERVGFDNQLAALERTLAAKQQDYEELLFLSGDANHAREVSGQELGRVKRAYEEERARREAEIRERHQVVQMRKNVADRASRREAKRHDIAQGGGGGGGGGGAEPSAGNTDKDDGNDGRPRTSGGDGANDAASEAVKAASNSRIDIFENAFRKIKEATGVSDVNEVIQKIESQEGTSANLLALTKENSMRIEGLADTREKIKKAVEEIKYSSAGGGHRRKLVDEREEELVNSTNRLERWKAKCDRFGATLVSVKAGIKHLQDKLEAARDSVGGQRTELTDDAVVTVLREGEETLISLFNRVRSNQAEEEAVTGGSLPSKSSKQPSSSSSGSIMDVPDVDEDALRENRPYNQRISLPMPGDENAEHEHEENLGDMDEEELTRDKVKKASSALLTAQDKRNKKIMKKKKTGGAGAQ